MISVRTMLHRKEITGVISVGPDAKVTTVARIMANRKVGSIIIESYGHLLGIVTDRDITYKVVAVGKNPDDVSVLEIMTPAEKTISVGPEADIEDCIRMMVGEGNDFRHLPVTENGLVIGVISIKDCGMESLKGGLLNDNIRDNLPPS